MRALSLAGGDLVGVAFAAGALHGLAHRGETFHAITGTSAGAIVGTALAAELARTGSWPVATSHLLAVLRQLRGPQDVVRRRSWVAKGWDLARQRPWGGWYSLAPLRRLLAQIAPLTLVRQSPLALRVAVFNLDRGLTQYVGPEDPNFLDFVLASASVPLVTPAVVIRGERYCDGGIQEIAPAVQLRATEVTVITKAVAGLPGGWRERGTPLQTLARVLEGMTREIQDKDLALMGWINAAAEGGLVSPEDGYRFITRRIVRAQRIFPGVDMAHFAPSDVEAIITHGQGLFA